MLPQNYVAILRYVAVVAVVYFLAFAAIFGYLDALNEGWGREITALWPIVLGSLAIAVIGTIVPIARFGAAGGSIFVLPTALHVTVLLVLAIAVATTRP